MDVVGGHRERERQDGALGRGVQRSLRQAGRRRDRAGVDDRGMQGRAQVGQRGPGHPDDAHDVDVEYLVPLHVGVVGHGAGRADARVVHQDVDAAQAVRRGADGQPDRRVVGDVGA